MCIAHQELLARLPTRLSGAVQTVPFRLLPLIISVWSLSQTSTSIRITCTHVSAQFTRPCHASSEFWSSTEVHQTALCRRRLWNPTQSKEASGGARDKHVRPATNFHHDPTNPTALSQPPVTREVTPSPMLPDPAPSL
jgi:hypothetical protein